MDNGRHGLCAHAANNFLGGVTFVSAGRLKHFCGVLVFYMQCCTQNSFSALSCMLYGMIGLDTEVVSEIREICDHNPDVRDPTKTQACRTRQGLKGPPWKTCCKKSPSVCSVQGNVMFFIQLWLLTVARTRLSTTEELVDLFLWVPRAAACVLLVYRLAVSVVWPLNV